MWEDLEHVKWEGGTCALWEDVLTQAFHEYVYYSDFLCAPIYEI